MVINDRASSGDNLMVEYLEKRLKKPLKSLVESSVKSPESNGSGSFLNEIDESRRVEILTYEQDTHIDNECDENNIKLIESNHNIIRSASTNISSDETHLRSISMYECMDTDILDRHIDHRSMRIEPLDSLQYISIDDSDLERTRSTVDGRCTMKTTDSKMICSTDGPATYIPMKSRLRKRQRE